MLFGVRWGRDLAAFQAFQQVYEPMNYARRIIGFDTFSGFPSVSSKDGADESIRTGAYGVTASFEEHLRRVLATKRQLGTFSHMERIEIHKGDAVERLQSYLSDHVETVVALAYFDLDLYEPTKACAKLLLPFYARGAVVAFDEFIHPVHPGETTAAREVFGTNAAFRRIPNFGPGHSGYVVFEATSR
ncbi:MAG: crotonobetainyl-CoA--carnitine CoA-transferase [Candidatus Eremiobacteraeota bacterium]|nr:crotonobetainyl-CoA--carnitine CoA-transferase [Candidatus Eremiobacteraeota bacterium]